MLTLGTRMNTSRLSIISVLVAITLASFAPAYAVRPHNTKESTSRFIRAHGNSIIGYRIPQDRSAYKLTVPRVPLVKDGMDARNSWTGLGSSERSTKGDVSPYGAARVKSRLPAHDSFRVDRFSSYSQGSVTRKSRSNHRPTGQIGGFGPYSVR